MNTKFKEIKTKEINKGFIAHSIFVDNVWQQFCLVRSHLSQIAFTAAINHAHVYTRVYVVRMRNY